MVVLDTTRDGYFALPELFTEDECRRLFELCIRELGESEWVWAHSPSSRAHVPLRISPLICAMVARVVARSPELDAFVGGRTKITELSAMFVFPGADPQPIHIAHTERGPRHLSFFVNLADTVAGAGAFEIVATGLRALREEADGLSADHVRPEEMRVMELPRGSVMAFDAQCPHRGGGNSSHDRLRPALYFSVGDPDIYGVTYAIKTRSRNLELGHFRPFDQHGHPRLVGEVRIARHLENDRGFLVLDRGEHVYTIEADDDHVRDLLVWLGNLGLGRHASSSVGELGGTLGAPADALIEALDQFLEMGIVLNVGADGHAPAGWRGQYHDP